VMVAVSDTGTGMDPATLARAVEPFFTTKEVGKGSGLGLSMVYGFARQSRGHVAISSELGIGTTVRLYLPRTSEGTKVANTPVHDTGAPGGTEAILLVEDDELVRAHVRALLIELGYLVTSVGTAADALSTLERGQDFDLLFSDVVMPGGMSGTELAEKAGILRPEMPVLLTSGYSDEHVGRNRSLRPGQQLLRKPYRRQELATKVRRLLDGAVEPAL
jgi:CheY-like chemotaxis protein